MSKNTNQVCEDCGDKVEARRIRCPNCGKMVCGWCYHHIHGVLSAVASERLGLVHCTGDATDKPKKESEA